MVVFVDRDVLMSMLSFAKESHPNEMILLLRGEAREGDVYIREFLLPPFGTTGRSFAEFRAHMLPIDFSIVGTAHSHPSGSARPSPTDLNHFYSRVMMIVARPYDEGSVAAYNSRGEAIPVSVGG